MIDWTSLFSGISGTTGGPTSPSPTTPSAPGGYALGGEPVTQSWRQSAMGESPTYASTGAPVTGGGTITGTGSNAGMGAGAPPKQNTMSGGGSVGAGLADSFKAIGDMISNYQMAGAYGQQEVAAATPNMTITPALANFSVPTIGRRV